MAQGRYRIARPGMDQTRGLTLPPTFEVPMRLSRKGLLALIAEEAIVLNAYKDLAGVWTIGCGHTAAAGEPIPRPGMTLSMAECIAVFMADVRKYERDVEKAIKVPLKQHEFDALVSFHFNTGGIVKGTVDDKINAGRIDEAMDTLVTWSKASGRRIEALRARRLREVAMFEEAKYLDRPIAVFDDFPRKGRSVAQSSIIIPDPSPVPPPPDRDRPDPVPAPPSKTAGKSLAGFILAAILAAIVAGLGFIFGG